MAGSNKLGLPFSGVPLQSHATLFSELSGSAGLNGLKDDSLAQIRALSSSGSALELREIALLTSRGHRKVRQFIVEKLRAPGHYRCTGCARASRRAQQQQEICNGK